MIYLNMIIHALCIAFIIHDLHEVVIKKKATGPGMVWPYMLACLMFLSFDFWEMISA